MFSPDLFDSNVHTDMHHVAHIVNSHRIKTTTYNDVSNNKKRLIRTPLSLGRRQEYMQEAVYRVCIVQMKHVQ